MKEVHIYLYSTVKGARSGVGAYTYILEAENSKRLHKKEETVKLYNVSAHKSVLLALIAALRRIRLDSYLVIYTDSNYVATNTKNNLTRWEKNGWKTARGEPVKHKEEWLEIKQLIARHSFEFVVSSEHIYYQQMKTKAEEAAKCI